MDKKNNEINEKQSQLDLKNKELEEKKKQIDLQVIKKANLDFFEKVKQFEIDIKNKDKQIEELQNSNNNNNINEIKKNIDDIKDNKEIIIGNNINYKDKIINNKENQNINNIENNNIHTFTKKVLYENNNENKNENKKEKEVKYTIFKDKSNIKTNFDYNNYKNKNEFLNENVTNEKDKKEIKAKDILKKESLNKIYKLTNDEFEKNISTYREKRPKNINTNFNDYKEILPDYKNKNINGVNYLNNIDYSKTENNKNTNNINKYDNYKLNKISDVNANSINKESKIQINNININKNKLTKFNNFENQKSNNKIKLDLVNNNEEDINSHIINRDNENNNLNKYTINNNYNDKNTEYNYNDKNTEYNNNIIITSSSISISQNDDINNVKYIGDIERKNQQFTYIYSLIGSDLISFNLKEKKFEIISIKDNTGGIFNSYIIYYQENKLFPQLLNTPYGFYILLHKYIFSYNQINNSVSKLIKLNCNHINGNFINIKNDIYSISGNNTTQCEKYSLISNNNILIPSTNFPRINSGICNIQNEYIYLFFGKISNSIERLYIGKNNDYNYNDKWEIIRINEKNGLEDDNICLNKFVSFLDDYNNIIIFGGEDFNGKENKNIFGFNLNNQNISIIGKIDSNSLYLNQFIKVDESIFSIYDMNNGLHFFNKELDYHEIFNLNA